MAGLVDGAPELPALASHAVSSASTARHPTAQRQECSKSHIDALRTHHRNRPQSESIVPYSTRIKAGTLAAVCVAMCAACGSTTTGSSGPIAPVSVDCSLQTASPSTVDGAFAEIPGFTVTAISPADVDPAFAGREFDCVAAALVSQNGNPMLRVLAGQLKSGSGDALVRHTHRDPGRSGLNG